MTSKAKSSFDLNQTEVKIKFKSKEISYSKAESHITTDPHITTDLCTFHTYRTTLTSKTPQMYSNAFYNLLEVPISCQQVPIPVSQGLVTLKFPSHPGTVGALVGMRWSRVKKLSSDFREAFPGFDIDVSHDGHCFNVVMANFSDGIAFVTNTFGEEISLANHGIEIRPQFVGRMIGKGGHNLRDIEAGTGTQCTLYHEDGLFWLRFPCDTPIEDRRKAMEYTKDRIFEYSDYLEERLTDTASESSHSTSSSYEASVAYSEASAAYSEASTVYTDDGDWPALSQ